MNRPAANTEIQISGTVTLTGGGTLTMSNIANNASTAPADVHADQRRRQHDPGLRPDRINDGGYALTLNNSGTIDANRAATLSDHPPPP